MAVNEDGLDEYIKFGLTSMIPLNPFQLPQKSVGKELEITYTFLYQATYPFSIEIRNTIDPGTGEITDFIGSITYTDIDTQTTGGGPINTDFPNFAQNFPVSSLCYVQINMQADCSTYDGEMTVILAQGPFAL